MKKHILALYPGQIRLAQMIVMTTQGMLHITILREKETGDKTGPNL